MFCYRQLLAHGDIESVRKQEFKIYTGNTPLPQARKKEIVCTMQGLCGEVDQRRCTQSLLAPMSTLPDKGERIILVVKYKCRYKYKYKYKYKYTKKCKCVNSHYWHQSPLSSIRERGSPLSSNTNADTTTYTNTNTNTTLLDKGERISLVVKYK